LTHSGYHLFSIELEGDNRFSEFLLRLVKGFESRKRSCLEFGLRIKMTPQEELFAKFFSEEAILVSELDDISLMARREEMSKIAFQARACLHAIDEDVRKRTKSKKFSIETDGNGEDITSDQLNVIKDRQKRMSKMDKVRQSLINMGVDPSEADKIVSARNIRDNSPSRLNQATPAVNPFNKSDSNNEPGTTGAAKETSSPSNLTPNAGSSLTLPQFNSPKIKPKHKPGEIDWDEVVKEAKAKAELEISSVTFELPKFED